MTLKFTSYDLAVLIYENYIDIEDLKYSLEIGNRGIRQRIRDEARDTRTYNQVFDDRPPREFDEQSELDKFNSILEQVENLEE